MPIISPFLAFHHTAVDLGDHGTRVRHAVVNIGNDSMGIYCKLGLRVNN